MKVSHFNPDDERNRLPSMAVDEFGSEEWPNPDKKSVNPSSKVARMLSRPQRAWVRV